MALLEVRNVSKRFGGVVAVHSLSFDVIEKEILGIIGPNGSGKTTLLGLIMGVQRPDGGELYFRGMRIDRLKPHARARMGIGMTHQLSRLFNTMTVLENMLVASKEGIGAQTTRRALELLDFFKLIHLKDEPAKSLSYGQQKLLELARILMLDPDLILLDEPTAGVNPVLTESLLGYIRALNEQEKTFVVVEHQMPVISNVCGRVIVLNYGEKIAEGTPSEIQRDSKVIDAYLGE